MNVNLESRPLTVLTDFSGTVVFLFRVATCSGCLAGIFTTQYLYGSRC